MALHTRNFGLTGQFFYASWRWIDIQCVINIHQIRFCKSALANIQGASIPLLKCGGYPALHTQRVTQTYRDLCKEGPYALVAAARNSCRAGSDEIMANLSGISNRKVGKMPYVVISEDQFQVL